MLFLLKCLKLKRRYCKGNLSLHNRSLSSEEVPRCSHCFHSSGINCRSPHQCKNSTGLSENSRLFPMVWKIPPHQRDEVGGSNTAVCARKLWCKAWELYRTIKYAYMAIKNALCFTPWFFHIKAGPWQTVLVASPDFVPLVLIHKVSYGINTPMHHYFIV